MAQSVKRSVKTLPVCKLDCAPDQSPCHGRLTNGPCSSLRDTALGVDILSLPSVARMVYARSNNGWKVDFKKTDAAGIYLEGSSSKTVWACPGLPIAKDSGVTITTLPGLTAAATAERKASGASKSLQSVCTDRHQFSGAGELQLQPMFPRLIPGFQDVSRCAAGQTADAYGGASIFLPP